MLSRRHLHYFTLLACLVLLGARPLTCLALERDLSAIVAPGKATALRLERVIVGSELQLELSSSQPLQVSLLNEPDYRRFPKAGSPLYSGELEQNLAIRVRPPSSGDYYLILQHPGTAGIKADVKIRLRVSTVQPNLLKNDALQAQMNAISYSLAKLFEFEGISIQPAQCGFANLLATNGTVYLCIEYVQALRDSSADAQQAKALLLFGLLHEISHLLLQQWDLPFYGNEELADQFATVLAGIMGRGDAATAQADYFAMQGSEQFSDARSSLASHPRAASRATNIRRWSQAGDEHVKAWMPFLIPHMTSDFLRQLLPKPPTWVTTEQLTVELKRR